MYFEAARLIEADDLISSEFLSTPRELIFDIKVKHSKEEKLFITLKRNYCSTYNLIYKECHHKKASTIASHLPAYLYKQHGKKILHIFDTNY